jgi:hypothetical protein
LNSGRDCGFNSTEGQGLFSKTVGEGVSYNLGRWSGIGRWEWLEKARLAGTEGGAAACRCRQRRCSPANMETTLEATVWVTIEGKKEREAENSTRGLEALWKARRRCNTHGGGSDVVANQRRCREVVTDWERGRAQYRLLTYQLAKLVEVFLRAEERRQRCLVATTRVLGLWQLRAQMEAMACARAR